MYKKFLAAALAATMVLGLAACGGSAGSTSVPSSQEKESSAATAGSSGESTAAQAEGADAPAVIKVGFLTPLSGNNTTYGAQCKASCTGCRTAASRRAMRRCPSRRTMRTAAMWCRRFSYPARAGIARGAISTSTRPSGNSQRRREGPRPFARGDRSSCRTRPGALRYVRLGTASAPPPF